MKYILQDGEIHRHDREADAFLPLSLEEAQFVVDVMNALTPGVARQLADATLLASVPSGMMEAATALLDNENEAE